MTNENFKSTVRNSKEMWLVVFLESAYFDDKSGAKVYDPNLRFGTNIKSKWRQVAVELKGKVRMGEVWSHSATENLPKLYDVTSFPTILCFPAGDKSDPNIFLKYEGVGRLGGYFHFRDITANDIVSWALENLNEKSIGKSVCTDVNFGVCHENRVSFGANKVLGSNFCKAIHLPNINHMYIL